MIKKEIVYWLPVALLLLFSLYRSASSPAHDFGNYYFGSYFFSKGEFTSSIYEPIAFNQKVEKAGYSGLFLSYAPNPPLSSLLFLPFSFLEVSVAKLAFNSISILLFLFSLVRLGKHMEIPLRYMALLPVIFALPVYNNILFGQVYLILFALLVEGYLAWRKGQLLLSAILWGIAIVLKITPGILLLFLLFRKEYRALLMLSLTCSLLLLVSIVVNGWLIWEFYITEILPRASQGDATAAAFTINYQSANMLFKYLFVADTIDNPVPVFDSIVIFQVITFAFKILIISLAAFYTKNVKSVFFSWAIWITSSILLSPYGSTYAYILVLIPLLTLYNRKRLFMTVILLCLLFINLPVNYLYDFSLILQFPRLYLTLVIFIAMIAQARLSGNRQTLGMVSVMSLLMGFFSFYSSSDKSSYLLTRENHPLVLDYTIENGFISYSFWTSGGPQKQLTDVTASSLSSNLIEIINNQIVFDGVPVTSSRDKKIRASLLNSTTLIYLSDKDRGYGFYAFRKLSVSHFHLNH
jgi:hypothetical protein